MEQKHFILSPCGTSLLTNGANDIERKWINEFTNYKNFSDIDNKNKEAANCLETVVNRAKDKLCKAENDLAAKLSAELNGIIKFYSGVFENSKADYHLLLCTDTWLGEQTANLVSEWLKSKNFTVEIKRQTDLRTENVDEFQLALSDLVKWCEEVLVSYQNSQYKITFNLTGGFKSVQGFLQTLAMFYADESIYVFETGKELLRLPRLPVEMKPLEVFEANINIFRRLSMNLDIKDYGIKNIPETLLLTIDDQIDLSPWGQMMWVNNKNKIYSKQLWPSLSKKISFSKEFENSIKSLTSDRLVLVNKKIDQLAKYLESNQSQDMRSLDFKKLEGNPMPPSTYEMDAWSDKDAKRIFGHYEGSIFILDKLNKKL